MGSAIISRRLLLPSFGLLATGGVTAVLSFIGLLLKLSKIRFSRNNIATFLITLLSLVI
jgi:hypothetical protein